MSDHLSKLGNGQKDMLAQLIVGKKVVCQRYLQLAAASYYLVDKSGKRVLKTGDTCFKATILSLLKRKLIKKIKTTNPCFDVEKIEYGLANQVV